MKAKEVVTFINNHPDINLVALIYTPWHLNGVKAYIYEQTTKYQKVVNALCIICKHPDTGYALSSQDVVDEYVKYAIYEDSKFYEGESVWIDVLQFLKDRFIKRKSKKGIDVLKAAEPAFKFGSVLNNKCKKNIRLIIIDEGVAMYMGTLSDFNREHSNLVLYYFVRIIKKIMYLSNEVLHYVLLEKDKKGELQINQQIADNYISVFKKHFVCLPNIKIKRKSVVLCTSAWKRECIKNDTDLFVVEKVINIFQQYNFFIYLKPHPRDTFFAANLSKKKQITILDGSQAIESMFCEDYSPMYVVSFSSTVLVSAKIFLPNTLPMCLSNLLDRNLIARIYLNEIDRFKATFGSMCYYPSSFDDIIHKIS